MAKKLSKTQKAKNKAAYKAIRREYEKVKNSKENYKDGKMIVDYKGFKNRTLARAKRDKMTIRAAAKREARTQSFLSAAERSRENILSGIKTKHREVYDKIRDLNKLNRYSGKTIRDENGKITKRAGQFESMSDNLVWDKERKGYIFNGNGTKYFIDVSNSPEDVKMTEIK